MRRSLGWCASATCVALLLLAGTVRTAADRPDSDGDGIPDDVDNCPFVYNPDQVDTDGDGAGDACDIDDDNDGVDDTSDPSPLDPDVCGDVDGDTCDDCSVGTDDYGPLSDSDPANDGPDFDEDGLCDAGDPDDDNDGVPDTEDSDPMNPFVCRDMDGDTCDDCSSGTDDPANDGPDSDGDGLCDWGDPDDDNDGVDDDVDNCPFVYNPDQTDTDADVLGDACDADDDNDFIPDADDNCPLVFNPGQEDFDGDGAGDPCDCSPSDPTTYPGAPETNDGQDNQCFGDPGFGLVDEVSGLMGFYNPADNTELSWRTQAGATHYQVIRADTQDFSSGCTLFPQTPHAFFVDTETPLEGGFYFLVRATLPNLGSWGADASGVERVLLCD
jgi:hypothetical protein